MEVNESLTELMAQRAALDARIKEVASVQRNQALNQIRALAGEYGLTVTDLSRVMGPRHTSAPRPAMFRDPATGNTWSGRGKRPEWLRSALEAGKSLNDFSIGLAGQKAESQVPVATAKKVAKPAAKKTSRKR